MKTSIGFGAFATFGNPNGFQQSFDKGIRFGLSLDLNPTAIELNPDSEIFAVKKDMNSGVYSICFCIYTYAREIQSSRSGTFIGSCVVFENCTSKGIYIYECLRELHEDIIKNPKNIIDDVLQVNHSSNLEVNKPHRYETIKANKLTVNNQPQFINHQESILIAAPNLYKSELAGTVSDFFSAAVKEFSPVGTLYFTTNQKVIEYVRSQGLIKIISLEQFREYKPPQKSPAKQRIEINLSEQRPAYQEPQRRIHIRKWTMDTPIRDLSQIVEEHNYVVDQYLELESENKNKELLSKENTSPYVGPFRDARDSRLIGEKVKLLKDNRKIVLWGAGLLIAALIIWVLYETFKTTETTQPLHSATPPPTRNPGSQNNPKTLSPTPTDELGGDDLKQLNIELKYLNSLTLRRISMSAVEATEVAIKLNPSDIGKAYGDQKEAFARRLIELNRGCFFEDNQIYRLNGLELQHVPTCRGCK